MSKSKHQRETNCKRRIGRRLARRNWCDQPEPMFKAKNIHYDWSSRDRGVANGGIGAIHLLAQRSGLGRAIDDALSLLKVHLPYHESDHVLNIAYNVLCGGKRLEDLELLRNDEVYLDALGAVCIPDPTTAGDFCRRFREEDVEQLMAAINTVRLRIWRKQPATFFAEAIIDADGTMAPTTGECKQGMDISYKGEWGYHPLLVSLANTQEPLYVVNRSGNRPSHEGAAARLDQAIGLCREAGFRQILLRGDTDFSQTVHLDRWHEQGVRFLFGLDAAEHLVNWANDLPAASWRRLERPPKYTVKTQTRRRPPNIKAQVVREREFENLRLVSEDVAEFEYRPLACRRAYRIVVVRKNILVEKGQRALFDNVRYFFYITNDEQTPADALVLMANDRCNQENLIEQLKNGAQAFRLPVDTLIANWAYMVMASLAWTLKAWFALSLPQRGRWAAKHAAEKQTVLRMEFRTFLNAFMRIPCQVLHGGRRIVFRLLAWNPWQHVFLRGVDAIRANARC